MAFNLYEGYLVAQGRRADALRDAEQRRLIKSLDNRGNSPGLLQRLALSLRRLVPVYLDGASAEPRPRPRKTASRPTL
jgi:hypothetical protein